MSSNKIVVRGLKGTGSEPLNFQAIDPDSFYVEWEMNSSWTLQLTVKNDHSVAYGMLDAQSSIFWDGQEYIIKQCNPDFNGGVETKEITATHVYSEVSRIRKYKEYIDPADKDKQTDVHVYGTGTVETDSDDGSSDSDDDQGQQTVTESTNGNTKTKTTVTKKDESEKEENQVEYSVNDVLKFFLDGNTLGFTWQVIGNFDKARIEELTDGSGSDMLSKITDAWPNAVIYPDNKNIRVYSLDEFQKDYGNRLDYQHNVTEFKLTYDSTNLSNEVYCIGAKYSVETNTETTVTTGGDGGPGADKVAQDAQKYIGIPYVLGGAGGTRPGDYHAGMDCGSYVSQVYSDFGISIPTYVPNMVPYFHQVSTPQTGDVGIYYNGSLAYHICLFLNKDTIIYEPEPGEACKMEPASYYYPSMVGRNDQMAAIVSGNSDGGDGGDSEDSKSTTKTDEYYYFAPFMAKVQKSIDLYGEYPMEPLEDGRFDHKDAMEKYAISKLQPDPALTAEVTTFTSLKPIAGDKIHCMIKDYELSTNLAVVGYTWYPFSKSNYSSFTLNTNAQNILDYQHSHQVKLDKFIQNVDNRYSSTTDNANKGVWTEAEVTTFGNNFNNN